MFVRFADWRTKDWRSRLTARTAQDRPRRPVRHPANRRRGKTPNDVPKYEVKRVASYRCSIKPNLKRSAGQSLVNSAAYITREKLSDERTGRTFNYTRHPDKALWSGVYAPAHAPEWAREVESLCHQMEQAERYKNAQLARPMELNLPHELTLEENRRLLQDYIRENFTRKGYAVIAAIHAPGRDGDERNIHAHLLISLRTLDAEGFAKTKREQQQQDFLHRREYTQTLKASWAKLGARHLERAGHTLEAARWSHGHKTLAEQQTAALERDDRVWAEQCDHEVSKHLGPHAAAMEEKGVETERGNLNRDIEQRNHERAALRVALRNVQQELVQAQREQERQQQIRAAEREAARLAQERAEQEPARIREAERVRRQATEREAARAAQERREQERQQQIRAGIGRPRAGIATQVRDPNAARRVNQAASGGLRVASTVAGKAADRLVDVVDGLLDFFVGASPRKNSVADFLNNREARREQYQHMARARQREESIDRMAEDIRSGRLLSPADVRNLNHHDLISIKQFGDDYMRQLIEERERERQREWGGRERERGR